MADVTLHIRLSTKFKTSINHFSNKKTPAGTLAKGKDNQTMPSAGQELLVLSKAALKETRLLITFKIQQRSNKYFHVVFFPFQTLFKTILL